MPLKTGGEVIGVLIIGFSKPYQWLPTEHELLRAIADRSALAIERARITEALREREARIAELSAHLLRVQEEERKRISRELHDETGQALDGHPPLSRHAGIQRRRARPRQNP